MLLLLQRQQARRAKRIHGEVVDVKRATGANKRLTDEWEAVPDNYEVRVGGRRWYDPPPPSPDKT